MKALTKLSKVAVTLASIGALMFGLAGTAFAFTDGQISGGDIYRAEDLTSNSGFSDTTTAQACDLLEYRVRLYNPGSATVDNVNVQADVSNESLTSNESTIQITSSNGDPSSTYGFTTVNFSSPETESYVNGTTQLLDQNDNLIQTLPDGITIGGTGVNVGSVGPSVTEFVQFQEKVECPPPVPTPVPPTCNLLSLTSSGQEAKIDGLQYTAGSSTVNGATLQFYNGGTLVNTQSLSVSQIQNLSTTPSDYTFASAGNYKVVATVNTTYNDSSDNVSSNSCTGTFTYTTPPTTPPPTPTTTTTTSELVNTGPGNVIAIFAGASVIGAVGHYLFKNRKLILRRR